MLRHGWETGRFTAEALSVLKGLSGRRMALPEVWYLYDEKGSKLFEDITRLPEYYLTRSELSILKEYSDEISLFSDENRNMVRNFDSYMIELGAGSGKKMAPIFDAEERLLRENGSTSTYIAADYSVSALEENASVYNRFRDERPDFMKMQTFAGTNEEAMAATAKIEGRKTFVFLGSSLGNYIDPAAFMKHLVSHCKPHDRILIGLDLAAGHKGKKPLRVIEDAYNDAAGVTAQFILNSLSVVNSIANLNFSEENFRHVAEYNRQTDAVEIFAECTVPHQLVATDDAGAEYMVRDFDAGDRIFVEQSGKFSENKIAEMARDAGMLQTRDWECSQGYFKLIECIPDCAEYSHAMSKYFFMNIVGNNRLDHQPIELRNPYAFYWGHIPAFTDRVLESKVATTTGRGLRGGWIPTSTIRRPFPTPTVNVHKHGQTRRNCWSTPTR